MREISAGIIIYRRTAQGPKFLILYHGNNYWNFPKGKIESEEKSFQAALRETREETGISRNDLRFDQHFKAYEKFVFYRRQDDEKVRIHKVIIFYLAETKKRQIVISEEHYGYGWFTYREALRILSKHKDSQRVLTQVYDFLRKQGSKNRRADRQGRSFEL